MALLFICLAPAASFAQTGFDDDLNDEAEEEPVVPVDNYVYAGMAVAAALGYAVAGRKKIA